MKERKMTKKESLMKWQAEYASLQEKRSNMEQYVIDLYDYVDKLVNGDKLSYEDFIDDILTMSTNIIVENVRDENNELNNIATADNVEEEIYTRLLNNYKKQYANEIN